MSDLVVLGHRLNSDGDLSWPLIHRLDCAILEWNTGKYDRLVLSGGNRVLWRTESDAMHAYLEAYFRANQLPQPKFLLERASTNTLENAINCKLADVRYPTVITSVYHAPRARHVFSRVYGHPVEAITPEADLFEPDEFQSTMLEFPKFLYAHVELWRKGF